MWGGAGPSSVQPSMPHDGGCPGPPAQTIDRTPAVAHTWLHPCHTNCGGGAHALVSMRLKLHAPCPPCSTMAFDCICSIEGSAVSLYRCGGLSHRTRPGTCPLAVPVARCPAIRPLPSEPRGGGEGFGVLQGCIGREGGTLQAAQLLSPSQVPASTAFVTDSDRPQPLW